VIVVDVETSGIDKDINGIISLGAVDFSNPANEFYMEARLDMDLRCDAEALMINGFSLEQVRDPNWGVSSKEMMLAFRDWVFNTVKSDITLAGHNTGFDRDFIKAAFRRHELTTPFGYRVIDLHSTAYEWYVKKRYAIPLTDKRTSNIGSDQIHGIVGLPAERRPHHALVGARTKAEAFYRFWYRAQVYNEFKQYPLPEWL
jgi:DNA polymerase III epsilon subunit-like protein